MPDSGRGRVTLTVYSRVCCSVAEASGTATGVLWSLGTPNSGLSGWTGGVMIGTQYNLDIFVSIISNTLPLVWVALVTI